LVEKTQDEAVSIINFNGGLKMKTKGYYCIAKNGNRAPAYTHETQDEAVKEAERLTRQGVGPVAVAQIVAVVVPQTITFFTGGEDCPDELPF
jgi:uncharacterized protein YoaH (UPF0181 family)